MNKQDIINSLNRKIRIINAEYVVVSENGDLYLTSSSDGRMVCGFIGFDKDNFDIDESAFQGVLKEIIKTDESYSTRFEVARVFYKEGCVLLDNLYVSESDIVEILNNKIQEFDDRFNVCNDGGELALERKEDELLVAYFIEFDPQSFHTGSDLDETEHRIMNGSDEFERYTEVIELFYSEAKPLLEELNND